MTTEPVICRELSRISTRAVAPALPHNWVGKAIEALRQAASVDEVKEIRDKAQAILAYVKQAGDGLEAQNAAAEIKVRAERRAGELLAEMPKHNGDPRSHDVTRLQDMGIEKMQSSRWQRIASIPEQTFEQQIVEWKDSDKEITTAGLLKLAKGIAVDKATGEEVVISEGSSADLNGLISQGTKFGCIYADPPWQYGNQGTRAATDNHYPTMPIPDICALPISQLAAENAHLHLWTTNAFLFDAKQVMEAWGFTYKSVMVWTKPQMGIGNYWRVSHEFLLLGVRGSAPFRDRSIMSWQTADRGQHSAKPGMFRQLIERVSPGPYLELFARDQHEKWTVWGNQIKRSMFDGE